MPRPYIEFAVVGGLREDYCISAGGEAHIRQPGGNALYAAAGARLWSEHIGLVARVGSNYPSEWLADMDARSLDIRGVKILPTPEDTRTFYAYLSLEERVDTDPAAHFARVGQPMPPELADYRTSTEGQAERTRFGPLAVRPSEILQSYFHAHGFHLAPFDFVVHNTLPVYLRRRGVRYVTCDPSVRYMQPAFADAVRQLVYGLDAFLPSEMEARAFFGHEGHEGYEGHEPASDLWQAAEAFGAMGVKIVVLKMGARGQYLYETHSRRRWHIPAYPVKVIDVTGAGDAYCGGFLVGLAQTHDPVEAALRGSVSASIVIEGVGAMYAFDASPRLAQARLDALRSNVRPI